MSTESTKMSGHRFPVMGYENSLLGCGDRKNNLVWQAFQHGLVGSFEIDLRHPKKDAGNYVFVQIGVA